MALPEPLRPRSFSKRFIIAIVPVAMAALVCPPTGMALTADGPVVTEKKSQVKETFHSISVRTTVPIPEEVTSDTQAKAISREAAIAKGQAAILEYVLTKKTRSKKTLAEAEIPSLQLQRDIRAVIKGAQVKDTVWKDNQCSVTVLVRKEDLKVFLRKN